MGKITKKLPTRIEFYTHQILAGTQWVEWSGKKVAYNLKIAGD